MFCPYVGQTRLATAVQQVQIESSDSCCDRKDQLHLQTWLQLVKAMWLQIKKSYLYQFNANAGSAQPCGINLQQTL